MRLGKVDGFEDSYNKNPRIAPLSHVKLTNFNYEYYSTTRFNLVQILYPQLMSIHHVGHLLRRSSTETVIHRNSHLTTAAAWQWQLSGSISEQILHHKPAAAGGVAAHICK